MAQRATAAEVHACVFAVRQRARPDHGAREPRAVRELRRRARGRRARVGAVPMVGAHAELREGSAEAVRLVNLVIA